MLIRKVSKKLGRRALVIPKVEFANEALELSFIGFGGGGGDGVGHGGEGGERGGVGGRGGEGGRRGRHWGAGGGWRHPEGGGLSGGRSAVGKKAEVLGGSNLGEGGGEGGLVCWSLLGRLAAVVVVVVVVVFVAAWRAIVCVLSHLSSSLFIYLQFRVERREGALPSPNF